MPSINIDDEKRLIVSIKDISSLDTSIGENQTVTADTSDINYIPGYVEAEKQRRENETERISNEAERKAYYQEIQEKVNNGEFKGDKGDKGEPGPKGDDGAPGAPGEPGTTDYNELQNKPAIPSKISDLVNDSDFVNSSDLSNKQDKLIAGANITIEDNIISSTGGSGTGGTTDYTGLANKPKINGVTLSGNKTLSELNIQEKGSYLESESDPVYTADKPNIALKTELFSKNYNDLSNKPTIPTKLSQLENDSEFLTEYTETDPLYSKDKSSLALKSELFSRNYNDLTNKPNIPTKVSDLTNDSGFINSVPDEYITETELNKKGYLTEHQDISGKVDKEKGKGLSTNDFTNNYKTQIEENTNKSHEHPNKTIIDDIKSSDITNWNNKSNFSGDYNDLQNIPIFNEVHKISPEAYNASNPFVFHGTETGVYQILKGSYYMYNINSSTNVSGHDLFLMCITSRSDMCSFYLFDNDILYISTYSSGGYGASSRTPTITKINHNGLDLTPSFGTVKITTPTKISDLTNDAGYITNYTETDPIYIADKPNIALKSEIPNNDDFSLLGLNEKSYNNLTDKPDIPTKTSELTNDSNFVSDSEYVHTDNNYTNAEKEKLSKEKNSIKLYLGSNYTYTSKDAKKLSLVKNTSKGNDLTLSDGGVKIGEGITHVFVSAQIYYYTGANHSDGKCCLIYKNDTVVARTHDRLNLNYFHVNNSTIIPVQEGDIISLYAQNDTTNQTVIGNGDINTYLNVIEI